ncbi:PQQ-binding-like beta-propeller repeat protein [Streptosporangium amethystogenes]|uniref:outer membrane protein assembly factor BamB family protein n=1 Tax=Streptosporangium amethystogenes TaxID=2002 RepID=UPI0037A4B05D
MRSVLPLMIVTTVLLVIPSATTASAPRPGETSPIVGIRVFTKDGIVTARDSADKRTLWKSSQATGLPADTNLVAVESESALDFSEQLDNGSFNDGRRAATFTGRYLAAETDIESGDPHNSGERRRITVLDALTGLPTWSVLSGYPGDGPARPFFYLMGAAAGKIIIELPALRVIRALDPRDGTAVWETDLPGDCVSAALPTVDPQADETDLVRSYSLADRHLVVAIARCAGRRTSLTGIDPASGRIRWERRLSPSSLPELNLEAGVSFLTSPNAITVIDKSGLILADDLAYPFSSWALTAEAVILSDNEGAGSKTGVRSISRSSGQTIWFRPGLSGKPGTARERIYLTSGDTLTVLDPASGRTLTTLSAPLTEKDIETALRSPPGWGARGGVPAADWPDACALLPAAELSARSGTGAYLTTPIPAPAELGLSTPLACDLTSRRGGTPVAVTVFRVYTSDREAIAAMKILSGEETAPEVAEHATYFDSYQDSVAIRQGRVIVTVEAFGDRALLRRAGRITGDHLEELYPARRGNP